MNNDTIGYDQITEFRMNQQQDNTKLKRVQVCKYCKSKISAAVGKDICISCDVILITLKIALNKNVFYSKFPSKKSIAFWKGLIGNVYWV